MLASARGNLCLRMSWHRRRLKRHQHGLDPLAYRWNRDLPALADHFPGYQDKWQLGTRGDRRRAGVKEVVVVNLNGVTKPCRQLTCRPCRYFTPGVLRAIRAGDRCANDLHQYPLRHQQQPGPISGPHAGKPRLPPSPPRIIKPAVNSWRVCGLWHFGHSG